MVFWTSAWAGETTVDLLLGARTAPDAALEQPAEWEPGEVEPVGVSAVYARHRSAAGPAWWGLDGSTWLVAPEPDAAFVGLGPRVGVMTGDDVRATAAARYDAQLYPFTFEATNARAEGLLGGSSTVGPAELSTAVEGVSREYVTRAWSFRTVEPQLGARFAGASVVRGGLLLGGQVNQGVSGGVPVIGTQLRGTVDLGLGLPRAELWGRYRLVLARGGAVQEASRPVFTPVGDYSDDADALSAGGFVQHRVELGFTVERGEWVARTSLLGRTRSSELQDAGSFRRTLHGQVGLEREVSETWSAVGTVGVSGAELVSGKGYLDLYLWGGLSWRRRTDAGPE